MVTDKITVSPTSETKVSTGQLASTASVTPLKWSIAEVFVEGYDLTYGCGL